MSITSHTLIDIAKIPYGTECAYTYDDLSRLVSANGTCRDTVNYTLQMAYDIMSNPLQKTQTVNGSGIAASHDLHFAYGHSDNKGSHEYNIALSRHRAKAVLDYLVKKGIPISRLSCEGFGPDRPIATNDTEEGRALNRRTEAIVVEK